MSSVAVTRRLVSVAVADLREDGFMASQGSAAPVTAAIGFMRSSGTGGVL